MAEPWQQRFKWMARRHKSYPMDRPLWALENCRCDSCHFELARRRGDRSTFHEGIPGGRVIIREYPELHRLAMTGNTSQALDYIEALCRDSH
jgi:hypothetical protein